MSEPLLRAEGLRRSYQNGPRTIDVLRGVAVLGILVLGAFIGIPSPPIHITMELLPLMDKEFDIMLDKVLTAHDPLGHLFSVLGID